MTENSKLEGILRWSLAHSDGTAPSRPLSEEDKAFLRSAIESQVVDVVRRMKEITSLMTLGEGKLAEEGVTVDEIAGMLEELQEHVESIDMANDLKAIGGLEPLLAFLRSPHAILRARAAEVVMTMVQNNERSQQNVMQAGGLLQLIDVFLNDSDAVARTKALGAISSLVRHNTEGLSAFRTTCGVSRLTGALEGDNLKLKLKALHLLKYLLEEYPTDMVVFVKLGLQNRLLPLLQEAQTDTRTAAADALLLLTPELWKLEDTKQKVLAAVDSRLLSCEALTGEGATDVADEIVILKKLKKCLTEGLGQVDASTSREPTLLLGPPS